ncbi:two-component sensor histidine kinase [Nocardia panacis]|uniref:histidine kinase n=1 Tax=Nocardia panacis TaxID=2340916 RepID=A0A3A4KEB2_9NOCA|nr:histidine kinase [Nocardia panacis]RJO73845.1 two-component sensor histidine kinase [Nocardia panacis]
MDTAAVGSRKPNNVKSLARQSQLVALGCLVADVGWILRVFDEMAGQWVYWVVIGLIVVADLALIAPAQYSSQVAVLNVAVMLIAEVLLAGTIATHGHNDTGTMIAAYRVGAWSRGWPGALAIATLFGGEIATRMLGSHYDLAVLLLIGLRGAALPWLVGRYTTARRAHLAELDRKADNARRDAQAAIAQAVADERRAIALDLHDMVSHHVSAIGVHAGAARLGMGTPTGAPILERALNEVEGSSRAAMADLRRMLDLLHGTDEDGARQPGLANLDELIDGVRAAGLQVLVEPTGDGPVPGSLDIALYRITQEMLTNALRHGAGPVRLRIDRGHDTLTLSSENRLQTRSAPAESSGRGLAGIHRRAVLFDGKVDYGIEDGVWHTTVTFPLAVS